MLLRCYTQNIDGLEKQVGFDMDLSLEGKVVALHGSLETLVCSFCGHTIPFDVTHIEQFSSSNSINHHQIPCQECENHNAARKLENMRIRPAGILRPNIILYNEAHPASEIIGQITMYDFKKRPDFLLVMGTSLMIPAVKRLVKEFSKSVHATSIKGKGEFCKGGV